MLMARMVIAARVLKGSQVHLLPFKLVFTLSDQKICLPMLPKVFPSHCYIAIYIMYYMLILM